MAIVEIGGARFEHKDIIDDDPNDRAFLAMVPQFAPHTMTVRHGLAPPYALFRAIEHVVKRAIPGEIVECGVWRGGSMILAALALAHFADTKRTLRGFDTFQGMTEPSELDVDFDGRDLKAIWVAATQQGGRMGFGGTLPEVRARIQSTGYPEDRIVLVRGDVLATIPASAPEHVALLRLDTDFYASTRHELEHLYPRLSPGGVLFIDDYGWCRGARRATDEYFGTLADPPMLVRIDDSVRLAIKPAK